MMWETLFCEVLEETVVEVDIPRDTVIERLCQLRGECQQQDVEQQPLEFGCTRRGSFWVYDPFYRRSYNRRSFFRERDYYVTGRVMEEQGKTVVRIFSVYEKADVILRWLSVLVGILVLGGYLIWKLATDAQVLAKELLLIAGLIGAMWYSAYRTLRNKETKSKNFEIMKSEVLRRVEAVKNWDR